ncbi:MAG: mechanosensitive ion channel [Chlorobi bacterium]|nr:mechanosensitive ion channel [Chlorobiota bacterium]
MKLPQLETLLSKTGLPENWAEGLSSLIWLIVAVTIAIFAYWLIRKIIQQTIYRVIRKTSTHKDDILMKHKVFEKLAHLVPIAIIYMFIPVITGKHTGWATIMGHSLYVYLIIVGMMFLNTLFNALHNIYLTLPISQNRPIKGYIQILQVLVIFTSILFIIAVIFDTSLTRLFTGLSAMAAIILLIFKDTILGFVASIQLAVNNMVNPGDWIEMPGRGADGTVMEITLYTVKVQNWDKTIVTIPTYALVSESFHNWRGMEESGGRRIKRSFFIDIKSIRFCTPEMIEKFRRIQFLKDYIDNKIREIEAYNKKFNIDDSVLVNGRRMTNIGTFRKYIEEYLRHHPMIHTGMTLMVRQLKPAETGLPIEIYVFSKDQRWVNYEAIQADIFDHILSVIPEFGLRAFQNPSGYDISELAGHIIA